MVTGTGCGGEGEFGGGCGGVAGALVAPVGQNQDDSVIEGPSPGVAFPVWVASGLRCSVRAAAELAEGGGVAAGFGEEVAVMRKAA